MSETELMAMSAIIWKVYDTKKSEIIKGFVVGVVNMEMDAKDGRLPVMGEVTLNKIYESFPGLEAATKAFVEG